MTFRQIVNALVLLTASPAGARREQRSHVLKAADGLPCELQVKYVKAKDYDDELVDGFKLMLDCFEAVTHGVLEQPQLTKSGETTRWLPIEIKGSGEDAELGKGTHFLRTLRLNDEINKETYLGTTFRFKAKKSDGEEGEVSVKIEGPPAADEKPEVTEGREEAGEGLPCTMEVNTVDLQGGGKGYQVTLDCKAKVTNCVLDAPKPYGEKRYQAMGPGKYNLLVVDGSKLQSKAFAFIARTEEGTKGSLTVTAPDMPTTTAKPEEPTEGEEPATTAAEVPAPTTAAPDTESADAAGSLPCTLKKEEVGLQDGGKGWELSVECTEEVTDCKLKCPPFADMGYQALQAGSYTLIVLGQADVEGKTCVFEGTSKGAVATSNEVAM